MKASNNKIKMVPRLLFEGWSISNYQQLFSSEADMQTLANFIKDNLNVSLHINFGQPTCTCSLYCSRVFTLYYQMLGFNTHSIVSLTLAHKLVVGTARECIAHKMSHEMMWCHLVIINYIWRFTCGLLSLCPSKPSISECLHVVIPTTTSPKNWCSSFYAARVFVF